MKILQRQNSFCKLLELIIISLLFTSSFSKEFIYKLTKLQLYSEIELTIKGKGNQYLLSTDIPEYGSYKGPLPDELLINGDTKTVKNPMNYYLTEDYNYITLIWNSPISDTDAMFNGVNNIIKIVVKHFDSNSIRMNWMFANMAQLSSIDLSNLNTSLVTSFHCLFSNCISLISLDLSNFNTSQVRDMYQIFQNCRSLVFLNLKSFTDKSLSSKDMFSGIRSNLIYCIDEQKAPKISSLIKSKSSNNNCSNAFFLHSAILLINEKKSISFYEQNISFPYEYNNEYSHNCTKGTIINLYNDYPYEELNCQKNYYFNQADSLKEIPEGYFVNISYLKTIDKCNYYYSGKCSYECINNNNNEICKDLFKENSIKYLIYSAMKNLSIFCYNGNGYYPIYIQSILNNETIADCNTELEEYFLVFDNAFKPCFNTCKTCLEEGNETNNNCLECKDNYRFLNDSKNGINNCYEECAENYYYYFDILDKYHCTDKCPNGYKLIKEKNKCIDDCSKDDEYFFEFNNSCLKACPNSPDSDNSNLCKIKANEKGECPRDFPYKLLFDGKCVRKCKAKEIFIGICMINNNDPTIKDDVINNTRNELFDHTMDELLENVINGNKTDLITVQGNTIFTLTTTDNQKNNEKKNESTIDLGGCENKLKWHYNISTNESLIIFKIDLFEKGSDIPTIEYEIYNSETKEKLKLIYCKDTKIKINIPAKIDLKNEFKYSPVSDYYKDICFAYTTEDGTDIILKDRKNEFFDKNLSICESNCDYERYNSELEKATCECEVKFKMPLISEIVINKDLLKSKFVDVKNYINLNVMKCYNILFTSNGLLLNIGSYIILSIIFLSKILLVEFIFKGFKNLCDKIYEIYKGSKCSKNKEIINNSNIIKTTGNTNKGKSKKRKRKRKKKKKNNSHIKEPPKKNNNKRKKMIIIKQ